MSPSPIDLPTDHADRVERMKLSLLGLQLGDTLGELLCFEPLEVRQALAIHRLPEVAWLHTDDTEMAISLAQVLQWLGHVDQEILADQFVRRYARDPNRGYGRMMRLQLERIMGGAQWQETSRSAFDGEGSMGNGSAMRVAPLGAYFAEDLEAGVEAARHSSTVTHTHPEGIAGAIAVAVGAAMAWQLRRQPAAERADRFFESVLRHTPESEVRNGILSAREMGPEAHLLEAALKLGCGSRVTAPDTVPFCMWIAAHHLDDYSQALGRTLSVGGDSDTNAAIVGGMVALSVGKEGLPEACVERLEALPV